MNFGMSDSRKTIKLPLCIPELEEYSSTKITGYDGDYAEVILTHEDMVQCLDPVVMMIIALVAQQVRDVHKAAKPAVKTVALVGDFGSSPYLSDKLRNWCSQHNIRLTTPWDGV